MPTERYFPMQVVPKAHNLSMIGWADGYLMVIYKGKSDRWIYGPAISADEVDKILRVPYPDKIFHQLRIKHDWQSYKLTK